MRRKAKWIFTLIAVILFIIPAGQVPNDPIKSRAMAVGLGVDCDDEGNIVVCAQIFTAAGKQGESAGTVVVEEKAKMFSTAVAKITEVCGLTLTVTHCNVVLLGQKLIESGDFFKQVFNLMENTYISDNAYVFACEGTPKGIFSSTSGFGNNASLYLQSLVSANGTFDDIPYKTVRQIVVDYHNIGNISYLPYVQRKRIEGNVPSSNEKPANASEEEKGEDYSYNLNSVLIMKRSSPIGVYGEETIKAINYILTKVDRGSEYFDVEEGTVGLYVLENSIKQNFDYEKRVYNVELELGVTVKDIYPYAEEDNDETFSYKLSEKDKEICAGIIKERIVSFFKEMQEKDADVFKVGQSFYSKYGKKGREINLKDVKFELSVKISEEK